jgi:TetR/AcrR family transcriptional regulator, transcriptional repressor for nem operon
MNRAASRSKELTHERIDALVTVATMVGALTLARAVDDPKLSDALREAALKHLISNHG